MKKILVIKLGALGDFIIALGGIMKLRERFPEAEFTMMTHKSLIPIAKQTGMFSSFITDNRGSYMNFREQARLFREVMAGDFDAVIDFQANPRTEKKYYSVMRWFMSRPYCWINTIKRVKRNIDKTHAFSWGKCTEEEFITQWPKTDLSFLHGENKYFHELPERFVLMIPGCSPTHPYKRWPVENFSAVAQKLAERGIHSVVMGTKAESAEVEAIVASTPMAVSMLNKTSLLDIPDLVQRSLAAVGNDTGPSHIAAYSGRPNIAIFDQRTAASVTNGPQSINLVSPSTIDLITVDMVWEKLLPIIEAAEAKS